MLLVWREVHHGIALYRRMEESDAVMVDPVPKGHAITVCWWVLDLYENKVLGRLLVRTISPDRVKRSRFATDRITEKPGPDRGEAFQSLGGP